MTDTTTKGALTENYKKSLEELNKVKARLKELE